MKKTYIQPSTLTVVLQHTSLIMDVSKVESDGVLNSTTEAGDGTGDAAPRVKATNIWDEEW